jgi:DNA-binding NarL/FixJ family response regulator
MMTTRILLIDDHAMFRSGISMVLSAGMPGAEIFEASSLNDAIHSAPDMLDVMLLDIKMPGLNGVDGIALLKRKWPQVPVIVLSSQDEPETVRLALSRGAKKFISKADTADKIIDLINDVLHGDTKTPGSPVALGDDKSDKHSHLTLRQCEVLELLCEGMSNKLIGRQLNLSENTVRGHVQGILEFLQVSSRSEAAFAARKRGLVS